MLNYFERINSYMGISFKKIKVWSSQNTAFDHTFDHLQTRTTWKQCFEEHTKAPFLDTKAPKITKNHPKNLYRCVRDIETVSSNPMAKIIKILLFYKHFCRKKIKVLSPFSCFCLNYRQEKTVSFLYINISNFPFRLWLW